MERTERLVIVRPALEHFDALAERGRDGLAALIGAEVPQEWPLFPESIARPEQVPEDTSPWRPYWAVHAADSVLILEGGLVPPDESGEAVFGYGLVPAYRGKGLATEFARFLVVTAFAHPEARAVGARTFPAGAVSPEEGFPADPSIAVLERLGFACVERGELWHWRLDRPPEV
ncbi:GNAT family N-acetyltransferase [Actinomadura sp. 9N215]|uniref:GNAT family N-acetyltransferase n=1 Tax=Actinomadura sp. 9N215 TaxID=3375150 RepID=UPI0037A5AC40